MNSKDRSASGRRREGRFEWSALSDLAPYLWPRGEVETKLRVVAALAFLAAAKVAIVYIPMLYKEAVDRLGGADGPLITVPVGVIVGYGVVRILSIAFAELRDAIFAKVGQRAIRAVALKGFPASSSARIAVPSRTPDRRPVPRDRTGYQGDRLPASVHAVQHPAHAA